MIRENQTIGIFVHGKPALDVIGQPLVKTGGRQADALGAYIGKIAIAEVRQVGGIFTSEARCAADTAQRIASRTLMPSVTEIRALGDKSGVIDYGLTPETIAFHLDPIIGTLGLVIIVTHLELIDRVLVAIAGRDVRVQGGYQVMTYGSGYIVRMQQGVVSVRRVVNKVTK